MPQEVLVIPQHNQRILLLDMLCPNVVKIYFKYLSMSLKGFIALSLLQHIKLPVIR